MRRGVLAHHAIAEAGDPWAWLDDVLPKDDMNIVVVSDLVALKYWSGPASNMWRLCGVNCFSGSDNISDLWQM